MDNSTAALPNEALLVARSAVDASAFAAVYDHYFSRIYNYIRYRVQDADTTDDITAQVFERALANISSYQPDKAPFAAWLFAIARNAVNDSLRQRQRQRRRWLSLDMLHHWASAEPEPGELVGDAETKELLLKAVARLGDRERDLIGLKFAGGLTNRRIAEMTGANLNGADFSKADLLGANFSEASMRNGNLQQAGLHAANLAGVDLTGADLSRAHLHATNFNRANLSGANLHWAYLFGAKLRGATLRGSDLSYTNLQEADLSSSNLGGANLFGANLAGANLVNAVLDQANLMNADLTGAAMPQGWQNIVAAY